MKVTIVVETGLLVDSVSLFETTPVTEKMIREIAKEYFESNNAKALVELLQHSLFKEERERIERQEKEAQTK